MADNFYDKVLERLKTLTTLAPEPLLEVNGFSQPGQTFVKALGGRTKVSIGITLINVNTSVTIGLRCRLNSAGQPFPLSADGSPTVTLTANGSYLYTWEGAADAIQVSFESETGGTTAEFTFILRAQ